MWNSSATRRPWLARVRRPEWVAQALALAVMVVATVVLVGWGTRPWIRVPALLEYVMVSPIIALSLFALGGGVVLTARWPEHRVRRRAAAASGLMTALVAATLLLCALLGGPDLEGGLYGAAERFLGEPIRPTAPAAALLVLSSSLALLALLRGRRWACEAAVGLASGSWLLGVIALMGHWYGVPMYSIALSPALLPGGAAFVLLSTSLLAAIGTRSRVLRKLAGPSVRAQILRAFIPVLLVFIVIDGWSHVILLRTPETARPILYALAETLALGTLTFGVAVWVAQRLGGALDRAEAARQQAQAALRAAEQHFRLLFEQAPVAYQALDPDGRILQVNDAWLKELGYTRGAVVGRWFGDFLAGDGPARFPQRFADLKAHGEAHDVDWRLRRQDGSVIETQFEARTAYDVAGNFRQSYCVFVNITERKQAAALVAEQRDLLDGLLESVPVGIAVLSPAGEILRVNRGCTEITGYTLDEIRSLPEGLLSVFPNPTYRQMVLARWQELFQRETGPVTLEYQIVAQDGAIKDIDFRSVRLADGRLLTTLFDISERRRAEEALRAERTLLRTLVDHLPDAIYAKDTAGRTTLSNPADARLLGCTSEAQVLGKTVYELYPPEVAAFVDADDQKMLHSGQPDLNREVPMVRPDGNRSWQLVSKVPLRDASGRIVGLVGISHDITARKRVAEALRESEERFRSLYENATIGIYRTTPEGRILMANPAVMRMLGFDSFDELAQRNLEQAGYVSACPRAEFRRQIEATGAVVGLEAAWQRKDGSVIYVRESAQIVRDAAGHVMYYDGTCEDITARKQAEDRLQRTLADLARSNADLEQFAYVISHDLQQPLRTIGGFTHLLNEHLAGRLDTDAQEYMGFIVDGARRMQQLISDLLDYARVGSRGATPQPTDAVAALRDALWSLTPDVEEAGAAITYDALPMVTADATQLTELFQNLIGNAIKYRGAAPPQIHVGVQPAGDCWQFSVRDNGIGIAPEHFERIFVIFQRLHTPEEYPGTGIGLAVCKRIVARHGGRIWVESAVGQGTTFFFTLSAAL